jgi:pimeloyl-ACP methyl ester carboxylesterase
MKRFLIVAVGVLMLLVIGLEPILRSFRYDIETARLEAAPEAGRFTRSVSCWFGDGWFERSECAWLYPSKQAEALTALPVVILRSGLFARSSTATVYLSGGPGGSSYLYEEAMPWWRDWMHQRMGLDHDLVLYDQRGTGYAAPRLDCPDYDSTSRRVILEGASIEAQWKQTLPLLEACAAEVPESERREGLYSTATAAQDLRELVRALREEFGYREVHIYGVSYGTRLAQVALAEPLDGVGRVVLDGFYPAGMELIGRFADDYAAVLNAAQAHCRDAGECRGASLRELLAKALERLSAQPVELALPAFEDAAAAVDAQPETLRLTPDNLFALVEAQLTFGLPTAELHTLLQQAARGDYSERWGELAADWVYTLDDPEFSTLSMALIECRDNPPLRREAVSAAIKAHPDWAQLLHTPEIAFEQCEGLGVRPQPLRPSVIRQPTLLLAAEFDPRTPTAPALEQAQGFTQLQTLVLPRSGHSMTDLDDCAAAAAGAFLNRGTAPPERCAAVP